MKRRDGDTLSDRERLLMERRVGDRLTVLAARHRQWAELFELDRGRSAWSAWPASCMDVALCARARTVNRISGPLPSADCLLHDPCDYHDPLMSAAVLFFALASLGHYGGKEVGQQHTDEC